MDEPGVGSLWPARALAKPKWKLLVADQTRVVSGVDAWLFFAVGRGRLAVPLAEILMSISGQLYMLEIETN